MSARVTIVDYGIGNIFSVTRAFERCGAEVVRTTDPAELREAERLVLPGVGAFSNGMQGLTERGLVEPLRQYAASGKPLLGICLGMQMMFESSSEFGQHPGLGIIPGGVESIGTPCGEDGQPLKVPHIGWTRLEQPAGGSPWPGSILKNLQPGEQAYFVHSFTAVPSSPADRLADATYGGVRISAAVRHGNVYGCQFHPEKSGPAGLKIIQAFLDIH